MGIFVARKIMHLSQDDKPTLMSAFRRAGETRRISIL